MPAKPATVAQYVARLNARQRPALDTLRKAIKTVAPKAEETISYGILGFKLDGKGLVWCAAWKAHCSLYPISPTFGETHAIDLSRYETAKGTIKFPLSKPVPTTLVKRLVKARVAELKTELLS